ncbi:hypothetical protein GCM10023174_22680 [Chelativorans composti]|uniref:Ribbon-helix-helix protein CopG domain-containing protein n=1 Tax=Chelativorans composti TaxID=768533 RepID=A0ABW5DJ29_9HYPH
MARPKLGDSETERLHIKITADEIQRIDDWRYANRVPSRSDAVRRLVHVGLLTAQALPEIIAKCAIGLDRLAKAIDRPQEIKQRQSSLDSADFHRLVASELYDEINYSFNECLDGYEELMRLVAAIGPLMVNMPYEEAQELSQSISVDSDGAGSRAIREMLEPRRKIWNEHIRKLYPPDNLDGES